MKNDPPVFITDIDDVREFVMRCLRENHDKAAYWKKKWRDYEED